MGKLEGMKAEDYFCKMLDDCNYSNMKYEFVDGWFDFLINEKVKVEVKSCRISVKHPNHVKNMRYRIGRFDFTNPDNLDKQKKQGCWICFIVRHYNQFIILGFCLAEEINSKRYVSLHQTRDIELIDLSDWLSIVL